MTIPLTERQKSWLTLTVLWLLLLLLAALRPLAVPDEGRYGEIGRWMLVSADWLTPRLNGSPFFHKPPLLHWLEAASLAVFGVNELALRLVPASHAGLMLVCLYLAGRSLAGEQTARRAAVMLGASLSFLIGGQYVNHDMLVATWIGVAIWCFAFAFMAGERPSAKLARLGFAACALGMLSKGLIGIALPGMVILIWLVWTRQLKKIIHLPWLSGLALFGAIALPWFAVAWQKYPQLLDYMFINQQFTRYTASTYNNPQPWWFYLAALLLLLFPWVFFAFARRGQTVAAPPVGKEWIALCWVWLVSIVAFFSIPNSKLIGYVLPVVPALALLAALGWQRSIAHRPGAGKLFVALCALNAGIALALVTQVGEVTRSARTQDLAGVLACAARPSDTVYVAGAYPYDLPFYAQTRKPMVVLDDWPVVRQQAGDGWQRELFEGADFDPEAARVLQPTQVLSTAGQQPGNWFVRRIGNDMVLDPTGWALYYQGAGWLLYRSASASAAKGPETAEQIGLPGCENQRHKQRQ
ncbi:MAG: ArnT family glycosyltransferase [Rhodoferax sp.]